MRWYVCGGGGGTRQGGRISLIKNLCFRAKEPLLVASKQICFSFLSRNRGFTKHGLKLKHENKQRRVCLTLKNGWQTVKYLSIAIAIVKYMEPENC